MVELEWCCNVMVEAPNPRGLHSTSILYITKCFSTLICCVWAYGCTLTLLRLCRLGVDFRKLGVGLSPSDVVMSWLRLQTPVDCIPHPYHMYTKCFSTLICCEWAYGSTLTLLCLCRSGVVDFRKIGVWLSSSDVVMSWLRLQTPVDYIPHPYYILQSVLAPWYAVYGHMGAPLHYYACAGWGLILGNLG